MDYTSNYINQNINPGGIYSAIWMRDAAYILKDHALMSNTAALSALEQILLVWSHQLDSVADKEHKIVYGRGSPETNFKPVIREIGEINSVIDGVLPTTIYENFSEIYGLTPDIDSTALMVSSTAWILVKLLNSGIVGSLSSNSKNRDSFVLNLSDDRHVLPRRDSSLSSSDFLVKAVRYLIPRMLNAIAFLRARDIDNDNLVEQQSNEDWMDTALRAGKVVYSQACWILALQNLSDLLLRLGDYKAAYKMREMEDKTISAVEERLWSEEKACYIDVLQPSYELDNQKESISMKPTDDIIITQDVSLYLVAVTENSITKNYIKSSKNYHSRSNHDSHHTTHQKSILLCRATTALDTLKNRIWKNSWPLVTENVLRNTGPWHLKPHQYHNHTFWPWITAIEMLARSRFARFDECNKLLSKLAGVCSPNLFSFYEWVDSLTAQGNGAFPFRTGISAVMMAISDIFDPYL